MISNKKYIFELRCRRCGNTKDVPQQAIDQDAVFENTAFIVQRNGTSQQHYCEYCKKSAINDLISYFVKHEA